MHRVLLVEDETAIAESLAFALSRDGFAVTHAANLAAARPLCETCDLIVLDLMLPDGSGFALLHALRSAGQRTPVIVLSSRDDETDRVAGLEGGADDYVVKPFSPREIVARVRAVLRRTQPEPTRRPSSDALLRPSLPLHLDAETRRGLGWILELHCGIRPGEAYSAYDVRCDADAVAMMQEIATALRTRCVALSNLQSFLGEAP